MQTNGAESRARPEWLKTVTLVIAQVEEFQNQLILLCRVRDQVIENRDEAPLSADKIEELADIFSKASYFRVVEEARIYAGAWDLFALPPLFNQGPRTFECRLVFIAIAHMAKVK